MKTLPLILNFKVHADAIAKLWKLERGRITYEYQKNAKDISEKRANVSTSFRIKLLINHASYKQAT